MEFMFSLNSAKDLLHLGKSQMREALRSFMHVFQQYRGFQVSCAQLFIGDQIQQQGEIIDTIEACSDSLSLQSAKSYRTASRRRLWMTSFGTTLRDAASWVSSKFKCKFSTTV